MTFCVMFMYIVPFNVVALFCYLTPHTKTSEKINPLEAFLTSPQMFNETKLLSKIMDLVLKKHQSLQVKSINCCYLEICFGSVIRFANNLT